MPSAGGRRTDADRTDPARVGSQPIDPRLARTQPEPADGEADPRDGARLTAENGGAEYRDDLERIRFSPYFSRLAAVTQVISQGAAGRSSTTG